MLVNGGSSLRIVAAADLPFWFVIENYAMRLTAAARGHDSAVNCNSCFRTDTRADVRGLAVNGDAALFNPFFDFAARTQPGSREYLM